MAPETLTGQALQLLNKHLDLPESIWEQPGHTSPQNGEEARNYLVGLLTPVIKEMLDHSFERLIHALYRIDIPEKKVVAILEESPPAEVASTLTGAIVDRQLEKISLREKYRDSGG